MTYPVAYDHNYRLFVPKQAVGASLVYFDLFNAAGSGVKLAISSIQPVVSGAVAVTGVLGVDLFLTMTTAVGTGGTAATLNGTDTTACTISTINPRMGALHAKVTARLTPTGGATAGAVLTWASVFTEETGPGTYMGKLNDFVFIGDDPEDIIIPEGFGIRIVQGAVASVGNIGFNVAFAAI
jgi:hypothetical protein